MPLQDPNHPIAAADLDPASFDLTGDQVKVQFANGFADGQVTTGPDGRLTINMPDVTADGPGIHATSIGFDQETQVMTIGMSNGEQVTGGVDGLVTETALAARTQPMVSAFGTPLGYNAVQ